MLARRELSATQLRERLLRKDFSPAAVDEAITRLRDERALDDGRTASLLARRSALVHHRGPYRATRDIEAAGIPRTVARAAVSEVFREVEEATILARALHRRLNGPVRDRAHFRRLYQYLVRQGFDGQLAIDALRAETPTGQWPDDDTLRVTVQE